MKEPKQAVRARLDALLSPSAAKKALPAAKK
jgi:hypothetical protein